MPRHLHGDDAGDSMSSGPMIRAYALAGGRIVPKYPLDTLAQVTTCEHRYTAQLDPEHVQILTCCKTPMAIVEISALVKVPLQVTKVLIGDLIDHGLVVVGGAVPDDGRPSMALLTALRDGLMAL
jgi:hypothetical protein